jgi:hypothetical protein
MMIRDFGFVQFMLRITQTGSQRVLEERQFMFERYTEKARRAIFFARYEAGQYGSPEIEVGHLWLGLAREAKDIDAKAIVASYKLAHHTPPVTSIDIPLSAGVRGAIHNAAQVADSLDSKKIDIPHLRAGLLKVEGRNGELEAYLDELRNPPIIYERARELLKAINAGCANQAEYDLGLAITRYFAALRQKDSV